MRCDKLRRPREVGCEGEERDWFEAGKSVLNTEGPVARVYLVAHVAYI